MKPTPKAGWWAKPNARLNLIDLYGERKIANSPISILVNYIGEIDDGNGCVTDFTAEVYVPGLMRGEIWRSKKQFPATPDIYEIMAAWIKDQLAPAKEAVIAHLKQEAAEANQKLQVLLASLKKLEAIGDSLGNRKVEV